MGVARRPQGLGDERGDGIGGGVVGCRHGEAPLPGVMQGV